MPIWEVLNNKKGKPSRYFRRNLGTTDYYSHSSVTVDRIVMDVLPTAGNVGLPTGAPAVTNDVLQTIDFVYSGTISELCKNGANYFAGIMANVKYYLGGVQIHGYDIKSNSDNIPDTIGSNDATVINPTAGQWGIYTQQAGGEWLGQESWFGSITYFSTQQLSIIDYQGVIGQHLIKTTSNATGVQATDGGEFMADTIMLLSYEIVSNAGGTLTYSDRGLIPSTVGHHTATIINSSTTVANPYIKRGGGATEIVIKGISAKEILNVA